MKKLIIIFIALATFTMDAQEKAKDLKSHHKNAKTQMTLEQRAELRAKKMTLALDLTAEQQKQVQQVYLKMGRNKLEIRNNNKRKTKAQRYEAKNARLDQRIAFKKQMKDILTENQLRKWEGMRSERVDVKANQQVRKKGRKRHRNRLND
ncbi:hypothetical protein [Aequorivita marina]|uniref:hypothetical protein n=1 Tax=Aequorivita marina TaxID=3073654 RepID=UPI0028745C57|nr:hypothetical protein [Aequorivita sp. S2608]MDS1297128.1 hypothetical protein [Aequorivita sp. S2608]